MPIVPPHLHDAVDSLFMWLAREFEAVPGITPRETSYFIFVDVDKVREKMRLGG
jgi:hypothetical protein